VGDHPAIAVALYFFSRRKKPQDLADRLIAHGNRRACGGFLVAGVFPAQALKPRRRRLNRRRGAATAQALGDRERQQRRLLRIEGQRVTAREPQAAAPLLGGERCATMLAGRAPCRKSALASTCCGGERRVSSSSTGCRR
jgi:hypothetical protein